MGRRDPTSLRTRLTELQRNDKLGEEEKRTQEVELLSAIRSLGGKVHSFTLIESARCRVLCPTPRQRTATPPQPRDAKPVTHDESR